MDLVHLTNARLRSQEHRRKTCHLQPPSVVGEQDSSQTLKLSNTLSIPLRPKLKAEPHANASCPLNPQDKTLYCHQIGP